MPVVFEILSKLLVGAIHDLCSSKLIEETVDAVVGEQDTSYDDRARIHVISQKED